MTTPAPESDELFIRLDVDGLAALLKAVEKAMIDGRGHLTLDSGCGVVVTSSRSPDPYSEVIVRFARPKDPGHPAPAPRSPADLVPA